MPGTSLSIRTDRMIDLHCHSTASDGAIRPDALPAIARDIGVSALALTDHDTTDGLPHFVDAAAALGFNAIPGVELSSRLSTGDKAHIVGLYVDWYADSFQELLTQIRTWRMERNYIILQKLADIGKPVTLEQARACGEYGCVLGRPHIAAAMVKLKYCKCQNDAFKDYLRRGRPAYAPHKTPDAPDAIAALHAAGAVAIWAHPMSTGNMTGPKLERIIAELQSAGLDGIEAFYPDFTPTNTQNVLKAAYKHNLLVSGGTDFHGGSTHLNVRIGLGKGNGFHVPDYILTPIKRRAQSIRLHLHSS